MLTPRPRPADLPQFENPPVDEVAIALQFQPLQAYSDALVGEFRELVEEEFPNFDTQPRLEPVFETLTSQTPGTPSIQAFFGPPGTAPQGRSWFISEDDSMLFQLQDNTFAVNWRHRTTEYPRFDFIESQFLKYYETYRSLLAAKGLEHQVRQVEVTYINWLLDRRPEDFLCPAAVSDLSAIGVGRSEDQIWMARYLVREGAIAIGRLTAQCQPAVRLQSPYGGAGYQFALTLKVPIPPGTVSDDRLVDLIEMGHEKIVRAFTSLTTDDARAEWGEN